jgi:hypothetical protein
MLTPFLLSVAAFGVALIGVAGILLFYIWVKAWFYKWRGKR